MEVEKRKKRRKRETRKIHKDLLRHNTSEQGETDVTTRPPPPLLGSVHSSLIAHAG